MLLTSMWQVRDFPAEDQLKKLYDNMHSEYKYYIRLDDITNVKDLWTHICGRIQGDRATNSRTKS